MALRIRNGSSKSDSYESLVNTIMLEQVKGTESETSNRRFVDNSGIMKAIIKSNQSLFGS